MDALERTEFDAIVVGTGPGGGAVARELSRRGWSVLILERGPGSELKGSAFQFLSQAMVPGRSLHFTPQMIALGHGLTLGGSSAFYYATAFEPPYPMFEAHGIDLRQEVEEVRKELPVAPLRDELIGPAARRIMESAVALGYRWEKLPKIVHQEKCRPGCDLCVVGCPHGAKWSSRMFVEEACGNGAVLETHAHVRRVVQTVPSPPGWNTRTGAPSGGPPRRSSCSGRAASARRRSSGRAGSKRSEGTSSSIR